MADYWGNAQSKIIAGLAPAKGNTAGELRSEGLGQLRQTDPNFAPQQGDIGGDQPPYVLPAGADLSVLDPWEKMQVGLALAAKKPIPMVIMVKLENARQEKLRPRPGVA